jgi:adenylate cyclase
MPAERRIELRIGVNLDDVIAEGDDIFGDGVNVTARLEAAAAPGGVSISAAVRDQIGNRLDLEFETGARSFSRTSRSLCMSLASSSARRTG